MRRRSCRSMVRMPFFSLVLFLFGLPLVALSLASCVGAPFTYAGAVQDDGSVRVSSADPKLAKDTKTSEQRAEELSAQAGKNTLEAKRIISELLADKPLRALSMAQQFERQGIMSAQDAADVLPQVEKALADKAAKYLADLSEQSPNQKTDQKTAPKTEPKNDRPAANAKDTAAQKDAAASNTLHADDQSTAQKDIQTNDQPTTKPNERPGVHDAYVLLQSADAAGFRLPPQTVFGILEQRALFFAAQKNYPGIIASVELLQQRAPNLFVSSKNKTALLKALSDAKAVFPVSPGALPSSPKEAIKKLMDSTFTVDINNGIQIKPEGARLQRSIGSAFFITRDGYALTNEHVIRTEVDPEYEGISDFKARLPEDDFKTSPARVVGYDPVLDIALLKLPRRASYAFSLGAASASVGEQVLAIGSPLGLTNTVTSGIISSESRRILRIGDALQIDASVNPGNSGGPLVSTSYDFLGMVFAQADTSAAGEKVEGLNFAIPGSMIRAVAERLFEGGKVTHSWLGVGVAETSAENSGGLQVLYIHPNAAAKYSALKIGDVITHVNGVKVTRAEELQNLMLSHRPGMLYKLTVRLGSGEDAPLQFTLKDDAAESREAERALEAAEAKSSAAPKTNQQTNLTKTQTKTQTKNFFVQSSELSEQTIVPQTKETLHTVFPLLTGAQVQVTRYSSWRPMYRITHVFEDTPAQYARFSAGDIIEVRQMRQNKRAIQIVIRVLQQSKGYLDSGLVLTLPTDGGNFI